MNFLSISAALIRNIGTIDQFFAEIKYSLKYFHEVNVLRALNIRKTSSGSFFILGVGVLSYFSIWLQILFCYMARMDIQAH